jgi:hypothetical protein
MGKMYYSEEEVCQVLGVDMDGLMELVNSAKLQMYQDGAKHVYKAIDVDAMAPEGQGEAPAAEPTPASADEGLSLDEADETPAAETPEIKKEDTVITAAGISIFDDEDLEIEEADPIAETQIAPSLDDQIALDGVGSGSGLLDLTRESDDTSLGAEVLDHIDMEGGSGLSSGLSSGLGSGLVEETASGIADLSTSAEPVYVEPPTFVEAIDSTSGLYTGILAGACVVMLIIIAATLSAQQRVVSSLLESFQNNMAIVLVASLVIVLIGGVAGLLVGKSIQAKREMLSRMG